MCVCECHISAIMVPHFASLRMFCHFIVSSECIGLAKSLQKVVFEYLLVKQTQIKATSEFSVDSCLLISVAIHTENSQNVAWINWIVNTSPFSSGLKMCVPYCDPGAAPSFSAVSVDQGLLSAVQLRFQQPERPAGTEPRASLHRQHVVPWLAGVSLWRTTRVAKPWNSLHPCFQVPV